ncbi:uncharacterized protein LOC124654470 [Lolium rigidum]|uniref:uncharacterized protein LOC124654470 n=1 Tax=Lolium rigidum TaxID=89674 RepID=UPI001F5C5728|nr:uncharacterized protein LOC124654470 [Lolium rigidum]
MDGFCASYASIAAMEGYVFVFGGGDGVSQYDTGILRYLNVIPYWMEMKLKLIQKLRCLILFLGRGEAGEVLLLQIAGGPMRWRKVEGGEVAPGWKGGALLSRDSLGGHPWIYSETCNFCMFSLVHMLEMYKGGQVLYLSYERGCSGRCQNCKFLSSSLFRCVQEYKDNYHL